METKQIYNSISQKFSQTRKKPWPEQLILLDTIKGYIQLTWKEKIKILDVGCGSWRLAWYFLENLPIEFEYSWVDISSGLLEIAKKTYFWQKNINFFEKDMTNLDFWQQSFDIIIGLASFHHLENEADRILTLKNFYKILDYQWVLFLTNWNLWQKYKNYYKLVYKAIAVSILTLWTKKWNDIFVPRKQDWEIFLRYYHMFWKKEIEKLLVSSWFVVESNYFVDQAWEETNVRKEARNLITISRKDIW